MMLPRRDPYLWIHLAGLATVPLWLDVCLAGLAVGDPTVPPWLELTTLGWVGTVPILWMQLQRPFYVFSLLVLAIRPDRLSEDRRRSLTLQRQWLSRGLAIAAAVLLFGILVWLYRLAPVAATTTPFANQTRTMGWLICAIAFFFANLFTQVPATVLGALLASAEDVSSTPPYPAASIRRGFMVVGVPLASRWLDFIPDVNSSSATPITVPPRPPSIPKPVTELTPDAVASSEAVGETTSEDWVKRETTLTVDGLTEESAEDLVAPELVSDPLQPQKVASTWEADRAVSKTEVSITVDGAIATEADDFLQPNEDRQDWNAPPEQTRPSSSESLVESSPARMVLAEGCTSEDDTTLVVNADDIVTSLEEIVLETEARLPVAVSDSWKD